MRQPSGPACYLLLSRKLRKKAKGLSFNRSSDGEKIQINDNVRLDTH